MDYFLYFQMSADSAYSIPFRLEQLTKLLYSLEDKVNCDIATDHEVTWSLPYQQLPVVTVDKAASCFSFQAKSSMFLSSGNEGGHRKSLIPIATFEVRLWRHLHHYDTGKSLEDCDLFSRFPPSLTGQARVSGYFHKDVPQSGYWKWEAVLQEVERRAWGKILCTQQKYLVQHNPSVFSAMLVFIIRSKFLCFVFGANRWVGAC